MCINLKSITAGLALVLLQACSSSPVDNGAGPTVEEGSVLGASAAEPVPELTLNLPEQDCVCEPGAPPQDRTFMDRGFTALVEGDHIDAVQHFQRYQRLEKSAMAAWEAGIAIAYISTLQNSPFYDPAEARKSYAKLKRESREGWDVDQRILLLRLSLESFRVMARHMDDLEDSNATLKEDLEKREEAIKRLRELTLGQREGR